MCMISGGWDENYMRCMIVLLRLYNSFYTQHEPHPPWFVIMWTLLQSGQWIRASNSSGRSFKYFFSNSVKLVPNWRTTMSKVSNSVYFGKKSSKSLYAMSIATAVKCQLIADDGLYFAFHVLAIWLMFATNSSWCDFMLGIGSRSIIGGLG